MAPSWRPSAPVRSAARQPLRRRVWSSGSGCPERYGGGPSTRSRPGERGHSAREERRNLRLRGGDGVSRRPFGRERRRSPDPNWCEGLGSVVTPLW
ncbi:uncharacterized protein M6B38_356425 [Iris pallida]|uniref:Uncharacterized protein n=1 Tax=Iris pallida TaxID=29817 RepID=A0AAX6GN09_IRIPA|nr:uncharacterized protein M6B38_356425 [Iris pallida]